MTDKPTIADENSAKQIASVTPFNNSEVGLQPYYSVEYIVPGFRKVLSHLFGWDNANSIWRRLSSDSNGNLRTTSGTQLTQSPIGSIFSLTDADTKILDHNPNRAYFTVQNNGSDDNTPAQPVSVHYPNPTSDSPTILPPGFMLSENSWAGDVYAKSTISSTVQNITVIEYY